MEDKRFFSTTEAAKILGISRVAVFNRIKNGKIKAEKIGRNYMIPKENLGIVFNEVLSEKLKEEINQGVEKVVKQYGEVLLRLGNE
ncbi:hypothetical protein CL632_01670 [bacterium]|jgi:excisionase family DNA binding protein|nr:hypothetical protein [bacterium]MDP6571793.1 helix-turn-helix domain-containing protein [Patescibacteria group bacterium]MDP6756325.1 helix-turn-helix domain-containing protein [Patescibacteria group bacterium]|tara:strand:- start:9326 stop:9583 length:258 start_codon:yes stop_codon:yes gene_type:complete